ncbi:unnamed protein product [Nippostrongylus brasiliensis]|uniref:RanBD1 domain-containing protein n=1 Tax=Nippostrongylus brasiliensis TaxID=27835 RepID=A0A0N4YGM1_NIPBR|nr:unnamed protein product [Nippostrongylus brasiliensis]
MEASAKADNGNVRTEIPGELYFSAHRRSPVRDKGVFSFQTGFQVSENIMGCRRRNSSYLSARASREAGTLTSLEESSESANESELGSRERGGGPNSGMSEYTRFMASPEVQSFSEGDEDYSFENFRDCFELKYLKDYWTDKKRCALFKAKLTGRAKAQYEALPRIRREAGYAVLVKALREACQAESRNWKIVALSEPKRLRKEEGQLVMDFCVELERLTRRTRSVCCQSRSPLR